MADGETFMEVAGDGDDNFLADGETFVAMASLLKIGFITPVDAANFVPVCAAFSFAADVISGLSQAVSRAALVTGGVCTCSASGGSATLLVSTTPVLALVLADALMGPTRGVPFDLSINKLGAPFFTRAAAAASFAMISVINSLTVLILATPSGSGHGDPTLTTQLHHMVAAMAAAWHGRRNQPCNHGWTTRQQPMASPRMQRRACAQCPRTASPWRLPSRTGRELQMRPSGWPCSLLPWKASGSAHHPRCARRGHHQAP